MAPAGPLADDAALLREATDAAAALAADFFRRLGRGGVASWDKSPGNVVTEADLAVDRFLRERLTAARPDYGWLSEETADDPARLGARRLWIVDPIDGTRDFVRGRTGWAVSVALVEGDRPILGALVAPARQARYFASAGGGATLNGEPVRVTDVTSLEGCRLPMDPLVVKSRRWPEPWTGTVVIEKPNGIALRMAKVAAGDADLLVEPGRMREWDIAAAQLIVTEAGGQVANGRGEPIRYNRPLPRIEGLVVANPSLFPDAARRLAGFASRGQP